MIDKTIRMIVTDLDGTLLRSDKRISDYSKEVFAECRKLGLKIVFATARMMRSAAYYSTIVGTDALICGNGSLAVCGDEIVYEAKMPIEIASIFLSDLNLKYPALMISAAMGDKSYINYEAPPSKYGRILYRSNFNDLPNVSLDLIHIVLNTPEDIKKIAKHLPDSFSMEIIDNNAALIVHRHASKLHGIKAVAQRLGVSLDEILCFGDDRIDIEMLAACGIGVAMENAIPEAIAAADFVTESSDNDGVANYLLKCILGNGE